MSGGTSITNHDLRYIEYRTQYPSASTTKLKSRNVTTTCIMLSFCGIICVNSFQMNPSIRPFTCAQNPNRKNKFKRNVKISNVPLLSSISNEIHDTDTSQSSNTNTRYLTQIPTTIEESTNILQPFFNFPLDPWQIQAGTEILKGNNAIVCAPTGAGKTVVGEIALHLAFQSGFDAIYTTPLKALSNQKFMELRKLFGVENVGLSTGDMSINRGARITVMTTEVYRNMAWRAANNDNENVAVPDARDAEALRNDLSSTSVVVLDEFHYMGQPGRGGVWEECVITSPPHTQIVGLSATLPNGGRLSKWMESVTERKTSLVEAGGKRPVPLRYMFASRDGVHPLFLDPDAGPGSPKGLLGMRGDGEPPKMKKLKKNRQLKTTDGIPQGLTLNPILLSHREKQMNKIERAIQRKIARQQEENRYDNGKSNNNNYEDDENYGNRRYRGRPRPKQPQQRRMSAREEQRERDRMLRREMRKAVPPLPFLLSRLEQKNLLPAIVFIFSRVGCDDAAETVCNHMLSKSTLQQLSNPEQEQKRKSRQRGRNKENILQDKDGRSFRSNSNYISEDTFASVFEVPTINDFTEFLPESTEGLFSASSLDLLSEISLLSKEEIQTVASRIIAFNAENEEIAFPDSISVRYLLGVGSHHAGMLPAHKAFVETLFRGQLIKVVFATETLAAGINMPARTTVICSIAKRGGNGSINLLETSNMLQMAGRAGRRGMDTQGTCVVVATAFEGPSEASQILLSEIDPIRSQFNPSYSLAVNLVARGQGKLDVAKQLVQKSFAMWERNERENRLEEAKMLHGEEDLVDVMGEVYQDRFLSLLKDLMITELSSVSGSKNKFVISSLEKAVEVLSSGNLLKKESKSYVGAMQILELEMNTLNYLQREADDLNEITNIRSNEIELHELAMQDVMEEIKKQLRRVKKSRKEADRHVFNAIATFANQILSKNSPEIDSLRVALENARESLDENDQDEFNFSKSNYVTPAELTKYAKSATVVGRKRKKDKGGLDLATSLLDQLELTDMSQDNSFDDMMSLVNVLEAYGCLTANSETDLEIDGEDNIDKNDENEKTYEITSAGTNIALLGLDNALWGLVALGGAWDIAYDSSGLDEFRDAFDDVYFSDDNLFDDETNLFEDLPTIMSSKPNEPSVSEVSTSSTEDVNKCPKPQLESETLVDEILSLSPAELAGYVACLVADEPRRGAPTSAESFHKLSRAQQRVIQSSYLAAERLMEVQKKYSVDSSTSTCRIELGTCDVVTAWTAGCTWNEAVEMSGAAPGDLARVLHRALDALRQFGNLPFHAVRSTDGDGVTVRTVSSGIHPDIRRMCRDAADAMDRYPVKDPLPFEEDEIDAESDIDDDEEEDEIDMYPDESSGLQEG